MPKSNREKLINQIKTATTAEAQKEIVEEFMREPADDEKSYREEALFNFSDQLKALTVSAHYLQNEGIENNKLLNLLSQISAEVESLIEGVEQEK